ncbi:MAG: histidine phosphatase family protein [Dehalococcoidia bacterium]
MKLILIRHGESEGNAAGFVQGRLDFGLTALGRAQAEATAERLRGLKIDRLVSSPLKRAFDTASVFSAAIGIEIESEPGLMEYDMGAASGLTGPQIREKFPEMMAAWQKGIRPTFPGEEGRDEFHARVQDVLQRFAATKQTIAAVAHGGVVSAVCYQVLGMDRSRRGSFETANCSITEVALDRAGHLVLVRQNDTCHLDGLLTAVDRG